MEAFLREILNVYRKKVLFTRHALNQMNLAERMILRREVCEAIESDEVVEDYPNDRRGHSCLLMGRSRDGGVFMWFVRLRRIIWLWLRFIRQVY